MRWRRIGGGIALSTVILAGLALRWTTPDLAQDLRPRPDALEYEQGARNLVQGGGYHLVVDGERFVPRYPFGFSLLIAPVLAVWDAGPGTGVVVVLATAAGAVAGAWALGAVVGGLPGAIVAAGIVALSPAHVRWSQAVMSDVPSSCGVAWLAYATVAALRARRGAGAWGLLGAALGLLATVRPSNGLLAVPVAALVANARGRSRPDRLAGLAALGLGVLVGLAPLLVYDAVVLGGPLRTGYDVWVPAAKFSWRHLVAAPPVGGGTIPNLVHYGRALAGGGDLYGPLVAALVALGGITAARSGGDRGRVLALGLGFLTALLGVYGPFFWQDTRFLLPALPLLGAVAAVAVAPGVAVVVRVMGASLALLAAALVALGPSPYVRDKVFREADVLRAISARVEPDAAILVRSNDHYVSRLVLAPDRLWVPLGLDDHRFGVRWRRIAPAIPDREARLRIDQSFSGRFDPVAAAEALDRLVGSGRPVYVSTVLGFQVPFLPDLLRLAAARFRVERVATIHHTVLLRLRPR